MKRKLTMLAFCLLMQVSSVHAQAKEERFLIMSDDLPWIIDVYLKADDSLQIGFLPANLMIPISCAGEYAAPLSNVKMETNQECITKSIEHFLHVEYDHSLYVYMKTFRSDVDLAYPPQGLQTSGELVDYLHTASDKVTIAMLFRYGKYIHSDLSAWDYISYYKRFHGKKLKITYTYLDHMNVNDMSIPLSSSLHALKK